MKKANKKQLSEIEIKAISDIKESNLFEHSLLDITQLQTLYLTFKDTDKLLEKDIPKNIKMFEAGNTKEWSNAKTIPPCYDWRTGFRLNDAYAQMFGNRYYMYFEYDYNSRVQITDEMRHLRDLVNNRVKTYVNEEQVYSLF